MKPESITQALDWIDWYRRCLEDVSNGRPVRGLTEAKFAYDRAYEWLCETLT